jgi:hypothetical protein
MQKLVKTFLIALSLIVLTSCCQPGLRCNKWTEKECYYSDYYQAPPAFAPDQPQFQQDFNR